MTCTAQGVDHKFVRDPRTLPHTHTHTQTQTHTHFCGTTWN